jgi:hypothetical protein
MATSSQVHVVKKGDLLDHRTITVDSSALPPLEENHIRVHSVLTSLTANNLTYARLGSSPMKWLDAYPVPSSLPAPFNDRDKYGIVPCWGYAEVLESRLEGIPMGALLWGFWPTSSVPVDLELTPAKAKGHWIETSSHRQTLMPIYNRYISAPHLLSDVLADASLRDSLAWKPLFPGSCGYLLNKYVLSEPEFHPAGDTGPSNQP